MNTLLEKLNPTLKILLGILLCILIWKILFPKKEEKGNKPEYWQERGFKSDTFINKNFYTLPPPSILNQIPPKFVIQYPEQKSENKLELSDSLIRVLDKMGKAIAQINPEYLKEFPNSSKLVNGKFTHDSLQLDLLSTNGQIQSLYYHVNYEKFKYQFLNNQIEAFPIRSSESPNGKVSTPGFGISLYGNGGWNWFERYPQAGTELQISFKRLCLSNEAILGIKSQPNLILFSKLGYKIF